MPTPRCCLAAAACAALLACGACGGSAAIPEHAGSAGFSLELLQPAANGAAEAGPPATLELHAEAGAVLVQVRVTDAAQLTALCFDLHYDAAQFSPLEARATGLLGSAAGLDTAAEAQRVLQLAVLDEPGVVHHGQVLIHATPDSGFSGSGVLAEIRFARRPFSASRSASTPPTDNGASVALSYDAGGPALSWRYASAGDYDQNGEVNVADLTPLGANFGSVGPFSYNSSLSCIDGDGNGELNVADITPIGTHYGLSILGYNIYSSAAQGDYPPFPNAANGAGATLLGSLLLADGIGLPDQRLRFSHSFGGPAPDGYYWVRPHDGSTDGSASNLVHVSAGNLAPTALLSADPLSGPAPLNVAFDASDSADSDGVIVNYDWDWDGDGVYNLDSGTDPTISHVFNTAGSYNATLRVADDGGLTTTAFVVITVSDSGGNLPPVASFTANPLSGDAPLEVNFDASASSDPDGVIASYEWDFDGDSVVDLVTGSTAAMHSYNDPGNYTVTLTVFDDDGASDSHSVLIDAGGSGPTWHTTVAIADADSGLFCSMFIEGTYPSVAYYYESGLTTEVRYSGTTDPDGMVWLPSFSTLASVPAGDLAACMVGGHPCVAIHDSSDGSLSFVYYDIMTGWSSPQGISGLMSSGNYCSLVDAAGQPGIAYYHYDGVDGRLMYSTATDAFNNMWNPGRELDGGGGLDFGRYTSIAIIDGFPAVAYYDASNGDLKYVRATDPGGASPWSAPITVWDFNDTGYYAQLVEAAGAPAIAFFDDTLGSLLYFRAADSTGSSWPGAPLPIVLLGGMDCDMALIAGKPAVVCRNSVGDELWYREAADAAGSSWNAVEIVDDSDGAAMLGQSNSLVDYNGRPAVLYYDGFNHNLKYAIRYDDSI